MNLYTIKKNAYEEGYQDGERIATTALRERVAALEAALQKIADSPNKSESWQVGSLKAMARAALLERTEAEEGINHE